MWRITLSILLLSLEVLAGALLPPEQQPITTPDAIMFWRSPSVSDQERIAYVQGFIDGARMMYVYQQNVGLWWLGEQSFNAVCNRLLIYIKALGIPVYVVEVKKWMATYSIPSGVSASFVFGRLLGGE